MPNVRPLIQELEKKTHVTGVKSLLRKLEKLERESKRKDNGNVIVGYAASYALRVHEDAKAEARRRLVVKKKRFKKVKGKKRRKMVLVEKTGRQRKQQWKFLEQPARELSGEMALIVVRAVKRGVPLVKALILAGLHLQRASQEIVPIDTGNLRGSAFTEKE